MLAAVCVLDLSCSICCALSWLTPRLAGRQVSHAFVYSFRGTNTVVELGETRINVRTREDTEIHKLIRSPGCASSQGSLP